MRINMLSSDLSSLHHPCRSISQEFGCSQKFLGVVDVDLGFGVRSHGIDQVGGGLSQDPGLPYHLTCSHAQKHGKLVHRGRETLLAESVDCHLSFYISSLFLSEEPVGQIVVDLCPIFDGENLHRSFRAAFIYLALRTAGLTSYGKANRRAATL